ncbi:DNA replication complex GINS protein PSF1-like protein [Sarcoptes scabiei]|uniref:DNA replication complex GINS protein PSF1 n=1 Tax=Sarcoptes scabiei TaxID=52283 RepID=A0A132ADL3_SARSC|nr:DNA replication complex GINS protein PSF1-like protein [Sarcoptes scabiei]
MSTISQTLYQSLHADSEISSGDLDQSIMENRNKLLVSKIYLRAFLWNKRCLLAYHHDRLQKLKKIRWQLGAILPIEIRSNISEDELRWFLNYSKNLSDYMSRLSDNKGIDLSLMKAPPKKLYIQVRCITEYGRLDLDDGTSVILSKDSMVIPIHMSNVIKLKQIIICLCLNAKN